MGRGFLGRHTICVKKSNRKGLGTHFGRVLLTFIKIFCLFRLQSVVSYFVDVLPFLC